MDLLLADTALDTASTFHVFRTSGLVNTTANSRKWPSSLKSDIKLLYNDTCNSYCVMVTWYNKVKIKSIDIVIYCSFL